MLRWAFAFAGAIGIHSAVVMFVVPETIQWETAAINKATVDTVDMYVQTIAPSTKETVSDPGEIASESSQEEGETAEKSSISEQEIPRQMPEPAVAKEESKQEEPAKAQTPVEDKEPMSPKKETLSPPQVIDNPSPFYPLAARDQGWQGLVVLEVWVLADGTVGYCDVKKSSGYTVLDDEAKRAVEKWHFVPAQKDGVEQSSWMDVPVRFALKEERITQVAL